MHNVATKENGDFDEIFGTATAPDPDFPGELEVSFPGSKYKDDFLLYSAWYTLKKVNACLVTYIVYHHFFFAILLMYIILETSF